MPAYTPKPMQHCTKGEGVAGSEARENLEFPRSHVRDTPGYLLRNLASAQSKAPQIVVAVGMGQRVV